MLSDKEIKEIVRRHGKMENDEFIEKIFEIAFGDNAINRDYSKEEVVKRIKQFSDLAWKYTEVSK